MLTRLRMITETVETRLGVPEVLPRLDRLVDLRFFDISPQNWRVRPQFAYLTLTLSPSSWPRSAATLACARTRKLK